MSARITTTAGAAILAVSLLAGCQEASTPTPRESTSQPGKSPSSRSPNLPREPEAATKKTESGAIAFTLYYYEVVNYGRATDEWEPLKKLSLPECRQCADFWSSKPARMNGAKPINMRGAPLMSRFEPDRDRVSVVARITTLSPPYEPTLGKQGVKFSDLVRLTFRDGHWRVKDIAVEDVG